MQQTRRQQYRKCQIFKQFLNGFVDQDKAPFLLVQTWFIYSSGAWQWEAMRNKREREGEGIVTYLVFPLHIQCFHTSSLDNNDLSSHLLQSSLPSIFLKGTRTWLYWASLNILNIFHVVQTIYKQNQFQCCI